ncbi:unnamed protein product, partial [Mesorhabditis belari]|uniref:Serpentine receptor class gamma n=1 Tax=Mesorhabditis belari TaxID=2138241 RepID=A0AAF3FCN0_9BILA
MVVTIAPHLNLSNCSTEDTSWLKVVYVFETLLGFLSFPVFAALLFLMSSRRYAAKYSSPFFVIFRWQAIAGIFCFFHIHLFVEFPTLNIFCDRLLNSFHSFSFYLTPLYFLSYFLQHLHFCISTLISVNRLSVITLGARYVEVWKWLLNYSLAGCFGTSLLLSWPLLFSEVALLPMHRGLGFAYNKRIDWLSNSLSTALLCFVCAIINLLSTIVVLCRIRSYRRYSHTNLLSVSIVLASISVLYSIDQVMIYYLLHMKEDFSQSQNAFARFYDARFLVNTLATLSPLWALLILSQQVRSDISAIFNPNVKSPHNQPLIKNF